MAVVPWELGSEASILGESGGVVCATAVSSGGLGDCRGLERAASGVAESGTVCTLILCRDRGRRGRLHSALSGLLGHVWVDP